MVFTQSAVENARVSLEALNQGFINLTEAMKDIGELVEVRTTKTHEKYLKSHYWRKRKKAYWDIHPHQCFLCSREKVVHLHHRTYDRLWKETDEDLVRLCGMHHQELHTYEYLFDLTVEEATDVFLAYKANVRLSEILGNPKFKEILLALSETEPNGEFTD